MKSLSKRFLSIVICIVLTFASLNCFNTISVFATDSIGNYYVKNGGTGDGRTSSSPAPTVAAAVTTMNTDGYGEGDTVKIYIMQDFGISAATLTNNYHNLAAWRDAAGGEIMPPHTAEIILQPYDTSITTYLAESTKYGDVNPQMALKGPVTIKNLDIVTTRDSFNKPVINVGANHFTYSHFSGYASYHRLGSNGSLTQSFSSPDISTGTGTVAGDTVIDFLGASLIGDLYIGCQSTSYNNIVHKGNVNLTLDHPDIGYHSSMSNKIVLGNQNVTIEKNLNVVVKDISDITFVNKGGTLTVNGGVQYIVAPDEKVDTHLTDLDCFAEGTKIWRLNLATADVAKLFTLTETAGTYAVTENVILQATNDSGKIVYSSADGKLVLEDGEWSIAKKPIIHYGDPNSDGKIDIRDLINLKKRISNSESYYPLADVNSDKLINSSDLVLIKRHLLGDYAIELENYTVTIPKTLKLSGGANAKAKLLKNSILSAEDSLTVTGTKYYVAENGNSANSGTSEDSPIGIDGVPLLSLKRGDAVLFKRGDIFRLTDTLNLKSGVSYGAYDKGDKPQILGSLRDYADPNIWTSENGYLWQTKIDGNDAANLVFNHGECIGERKMTLNEIREDGDYHYDTETQTVYLYLNQYNPGHYFNSIEISSVRNLFFSTGSSNALISDITVDNISFKYSAVHSIGLNYGRNMKVTNCEMEWIGGAYYGTDGNRYGNAVEFWDIADGNTVSNNYIHQVFDAAITFQGSKYNNYSNLTYENNLIEYCSMNFEFWASESGNSTDTSGDADAVIKNINVTNNIFRFGGYGWGGIQRTGKSDQSFILAWHHRLDAEQIQDFNITENLFDTANCHFFYGPNILMNLNISNNTYYQKDGSSFSIVNGKNYFSDNQSSFETAIKSVDSNPKSIRWIS